MFYTSDLRVACKADGHRRPRGVRWGMLGLRHPIGLVDPLAPAELPVLCWTGTETRRLIMTCLKEEKDEEASTVVAGASMSHSGFDTNIINTHSFLTHWKHSSREQLFATFSKQRARAAVTDWTAWRRKWEWVFPANSRWGYVTHRTWKVSHPECWGGAVLHAWADSVGSWPTSVSLCH